MSHGPVGELTNTGVGAMGLKRGRPVQFHRPLVEPQKGRLPLLVPWRLGPAPRGLATAPQLEQVMGHPCQRPLTLCSAQPPSHKPSEPLYFLDLSEHRLHQYTPLLVQSSASLCQQLALHPVPRAQSFWYTSSGTPIGRSYFRVDDALLVYVLGDTPSPVASSAVSNPWWWQ